jgi:histidinol-phosphate aminotransferase
MRSDGPRLQLDARRHLRILRAMSEGPGSAPLRPAARLPAAPRLGPPSPAVDLRLDGNQGRPPSPAFWRQVGGDLELVRGYPAGTALEEALARRFGVAAGRVVLGAGADEVLDRLCRAVLEPGRAFVLPVPTFEMLPRYAQLSGCELVPVPWHDGPYPRAEVLRAIRAHTALAAIVSPNNPTGLAATADDVVAVCRTLQHGLVLVDAAYAEFADEDLSAVALAQPNAVLVRTFSKAWGLAGLRIGYAIAPAPVAQWLRAAGSPYTAGRFARHAAAVRLQTGEAEMRDYVAAVRQQRGELAALLAGLGWSAPPPQGNFVFARGGDCELLRDLLAGLGIAVRPFVFDGAFDGAAGGGAPPGVRITVPGETAPFARLCAALRAACAPEAVLLDLDGVLADVEGRRALASVDELAALARRLPVGVVTGCPRRLAESVLQRHGFAAHVRAVVCEEDGPPKPDPFPLREALRRLGAQSGWMLGDNECDVQAARAAGVVPFAIDPRDDARSAVLRAAGAARLVESVGSFATQLSVGQ